jgi:hypothetical protein
LETELKSYKDKWAENQCDLQDSEAKLRETEKEHDKILTILSKTVKALETERMKNNDLENHVAESYVAAASQTNTKTVSLVYK